MDVIGEILSNLYGATEVINAIERGASKKVALNDFMKRVHRIYRLKIHFS